LVATSDSAKQSNALNFTMDNLSFAVESMSRSLRMGTNYTCSNSNIDLSSSPATADCPSGGGYISFIPADSTNNSNRIEYELVPRGDGTNAIERCDNIEGLQCVNMIASNINVDVFKFFVRGS